MPQPPGEAMTVRAVNRDADAGRAAVAAGGTHGSVSDARAEVASNIDPEQQRTVCGSASR